MKQQLTSNIHNDVDWNATSALVPYPSREYSHSLTSESMTTNTGEYKCMEWEFQTVNVGFLLSLEFLKQCNYVYEKKFIVMSVESKMVSKCSYKRKSCHLSSWHSIATFTVLPLRRCIHCRILPMRKLQCAQHRF